MDDQVFFLSASDMTERIRQRELSPVEPISHRFWVCPSTSRRHRDGGQMKEAK